MDRQDERADSRRSLKIDQLSLFPSMFPGYRWGRRRNRLTVHAVHDAAVRLQSFTDRDLAAEVGIPTVNVRRYRRALMADGKIKPVLYSDGTQMECLGPKGKAVKLWKV